MLGQTRGMVRSKKSIIGLMTLMLLAGLIAGEFTFSLDQNGNQVRIVQRMSRTAEAAEAEREEIDSVEEPQQPERAVLEMLLDELEEEHLQEVTEVLESWIRNNPEVCSELRAVVENALEEQGQREVSRGNASGNEDANNNSNNSNANNNNWNNNINPPTGLLPGGGGNHLIPDEGNFDTRPSIPCDNSYWVANTRPVYMVGTPGFWTPRLRCRLCGFTTTCIEEAFDHSKNYSLDVAPPESCWCLPGELCGCIAEQPSQVPTWMFDYDLYYKYTPEVPGTIIHIPDGTYTCLKCGKVKYVYLFDPPDSNENTNYDYRLKRPRL